jgi:hypothetical protein
MAVRRPLVNVGGDLSEMPSGDILDPSVYSTSFSPFITVEVDLGSTAKKSGRFTIAVTGKTAGKPVQIFQAVGPYTGKGSRADEAEMDTVTATAYVKDANTIEVFWTSATRVKGNRKFSYLIGV